MLTSHDAAAAAMPDVLVVDPNPEAYLPLLRGSFRVMAVPQALAAFESMARVVPAALITDLSLPAGAALDIIHRARAFSVPPAILATTSEAAQAPDALVAGCDSILLKPFAPNLLYSRISRMLRARTQTLRQRSLMLHDRVARTTSKSLHLRERTTLLAAGLTREWPTQHCPYCDATGVTSFEYASHRRAWYACLGCRKVWMAKRRD